MTSAQWTTIVPLLLLLLLVPRGASAQILGYHEIRTDPNGLILPWYSDDPATAYDYCIKKVWDFWRNVDTCCGGVPYYMVHRTWDDPSDHIGIGGDEFAMALSSWSKLYAYSGDSRLIDNMRFIADFYLNHSLSNQHAEWPLVPYPCNTTESAFYDGDLVAGWGFTQPDKAGSFGNELLTLFEMTNDSSYFRAAVSIGEVLAAHVTSGDSENSPLPFRVSAETGLPPDSQVSSRYTANWTPTMRLFERLVGFGEEPGNYLHADSILLQWLLHYPVRNGQWGPFYEDIGNYSNTQINATTFVRYLLDHPEMDLNWQQDCRAVLDWTFATFADSQWSSIGVFPIDEQTEYMVPGNSHTSDYASTELLYAEATHDTTHVKQSVLQLNWATYMVDTNGMNSYPFDNIWFTDGYGDYVRHYLAAMAADPILAPADAPHILRSTSVVSSVSLTPLSVSYRTWDTTSTELIRLPDIPSSATTENGTLTRVNWPQGPTMQTNGWAWRPLATGGVVLLQKSHSRTVLIELEPSSIAENAPPSEWSVSVKGRTVTMLNSPAYGSIQFECVNPLGQIVERRTMPASTSSFELPSLETPGIYFVCVSAGGHTIMRKVLLGF